MGHDSFLAFARERHAIFVRRSRGVSFPWTDDEVLQIYRFTNVYRELDRTTAWLREHIREPLREDPRVLGATIAFRWFNSTRVGEILHGVGDNQTCLYRRWSSKYARRRLRHHLPNGPWVNGAYVIKSPGGMTKLDGVLSLIDNFYVRREELYDRIMDNGTLEGSTKILQELPEMGAFMAYEVITDLRHTHLLEVAPDILSWANPGPGARRGLARVQELHRDHYTRGGARSTQVALDGMQELLRIVQEEWPKEWPVWEMREVEHTLCEFDKYERARLGEGRPKQLYRRKGES